MIIPEKVCSVCRTAKPLGEFYPQKTGKGGLLSRCKRCHIDKNQTYKPNVEKKRAAERRRYHANVEESRERARLKWQRSPSRNMESFKQANKEKCKAWYQDNKEQAKKTSVEWALKNPEKYRATLAKSSKKWRENHPDRMRASKQNWGKNNPDVCREYGRRRYASKANAIPGWANRDAILLIYEQARKMEMATGVKHHVDHAVPLRSQIVCGLHCEHNLQVMEATKNMSKHNRYWPDMPI